MVISVVFATLSIVIALFTCCAAISSRLRMIERELSRLNEILEEK